MKQNMNLQTRCNRYLQEIRRTQESAAATPELSLFPHLQAFLKELSVKHFCRDTIRFVQEPRGLDQIGRPDFVAMDGLLPIGYIEAERYGRDLNNLTGHAREQNDRFIENLDNFILYRPFDIRYTYYTGQSRGFHCRPRPAIMRHLLVGENLALCTHRIIRSAITWQHVLVTNGITDGNCISNKDGPTHVFPLYLYPNPEELGLSTERSLNFKSDFLTAFSKTLGLPQTAPFNLPEGVSPEQILAYIYAILYSPTYRERYYDFLKYDFPRIPLPNDLEQFHTLAALGQQLIDSHLLKNVSRPKVAPTRRGTSVLHRFEGEGDGVVGRVRYVDGQAWINPTQYFTDVPVAVWEYEIGSYRVCEKWLRDRRGEVLHHEDVRQYRAILVAVAETLGVMEAIDSVVWEVV